MPALPLPHRQRLPEWLAAVAGAAPSAQVERLLPLLEGHFDADERLALHRRLWALWPALDDAARAQARRGFDGRCAAWCDWLATPFDDPRTPQRLALAHLDGAPAGALAPPRAPAYVRRLLAETGLAGDDAPPWAAWLGLRATLAEAGAASGTAADAPGGPAMPDTPDAPGAPDLAAATATVLRAVEAGAAPWGAAMALLFELALRHRDDASATALLAQLIGQHEAAALPPRRLQQWLQGADGPPLALAGPAQAEWCAPARLADAGHRARLAASLRRAGPRARLAALEAALAAAPDAPAAPHPLPAAEAAPFPRLRLLDGLYLLIEAGAITAALLDEIEQQGVPAADALAAAAHGLALQRLQAGDAEGGAQALARARRVGGAAAARAARERLASLLEILEPAAAPLVRLLRAGSLGGAGSAEAAAWSALADRDGPARAVARAMCARLHTDGHLEAAADERRRDLPRAQALWLALQEEPAHAAEARRALAGEALARHRPHLHRGPGREHLWVEPEGAANGELLICCACLDSRQGFAHFDGLRRGLPGHHLLFVNEPEFGWYSDEVFDGLCRLMAGKVLPRFAPARITTWYGSMGGTGALKLALQFGLRAVVFNPQTALDAWAAFRPRERQRLWAARRHADVAAWPAAAWGAAPLWLAVGSGVADRLGFSALVEAWRAAPAGRVIVEKFADPHHAGLVRRITRGPVPALVAAAAQRLALLREVGLGEGHEDGTGCDGFEDIPAAAQPAFWDALDAAAAIKREIVWQHGRLRVRPSSACPTL